LFEAPRASRAAHITGVARVSARAAAKEISVTKIPAIALAAVLALGFNASAQQPAQSNQNNNSMYQITMVAKSVTAINYEHRNGSTKVDFAGTPLLPLAKGEATVNSKQGSITISASFKNLQPAQNFGKEYLTYVLWAITPEGKPNNLGEVLLDGTNSKLFATTNLQSFGMIVTAEPYFAVNTPSDVVVLDNQVRPDTRGTFQPINANYNLIQRGSYTYDMTKMQNSVVTLSPKVPLEVYEARNAVQIAMNSGAQQYAPDALSKAQTSLANAEGMLSRKGSDKKSIIQSARDAVQNAADARTIALRRANEAKIAADQAAAAAATAAAQAQQQQEAAARQQADLQRLKAERDAAQQAAARAQADAAAAASAAQAQQADAAAAAARDRAKQAELEKQQLRAALLAQFNRVLPTTDTPRGLKVNMADVLFAFGKYDLQPPAREALAKFSGIVLAHPGLHLAVEGYTDSVGSDAFNQTLSEQRANAVRDYLVQQGLDASQITSTGFGKSDPVASNDTAEGRQQNRRVEIIISGEVIGQQIGVPPTPAAQ
jgi:outer membrane protein OmpA-like peptidoglycan-associated protein